MNWGRRANSQAVWKLTSSNRHLRLIQRFAILFAPRVAANNSPLWVDGAYRCVAGVWHFQDTYRAIGGKDKTARDSLTISEASGNVTSGIESSHVDQLAFGDVEGNEALGLRPEEPMRDTVIVGPASSD